MQQNQDIETVEISKEDQKEMNLEAIRLKRLAESATFSESTSSVGSYVRRYVASWLFRGHVDTDSAENRLSVLSDNNNPSEEVLSDANVEVNPAKGVPSFATGDVKSSEGASSVATDTTPFDKTGLPFAMDTAPSGEKRLSFATDTTPFDKTGSPFAMGTAPSGENRLSFVTDTTPFDETGSSIAMNAAPFGQIALPVASELTSSGENRPGFIADSTSSGEKKFAEVDKSNDTGEKSGKKYLDYLDLLIRVLEPSVRRSDCHTRLFYPAQVCRDRIWVDWEPFNVSRLTSPNIYDQVEGDYHGSPMWQCQAWAACGYTFRGGMLYDTITCSFVALPGDLLRRYDTAVNSTFYITLPSRLERISWMHHCIILIFFLGWHDQPGRSYFDGPENYSSPIRLTPGGRAPPCFVM